MAYLYRHIRLDKNQPFYIGIGKDDVEKRNNNTPTIYLKNYKNISNDI
jgi:hypothetical protein